MKAFLSLISFLILTCSLVAQSTIHELDPFDKIMVSHRINLHLIPGDQESVRFEFDKVDPSDLRYSVNNKRLAIYLEGAKITEPQVRHGHYKESIYRGAQVHAYVTYRQLKKLVVRGEEKVDCIGPISSDKFTLRLYGESDVHLASVNAGIFKAAMYGENDLRIDGGMTDLQRYNLYGENEIQVKDMPCHDTRTTSFGENELLINSENLSLTAFGETDIAYEGSMRIRRKIILGEGQIRSR